jgi:hypothetical protein
VRDEQDWLIGAVLYEIIVKALEGDGSTPYMPDTTPEAAAKYIIHAMRNDNRIKELVLDSRFMLYD